MRSTWVLCVLLGVLTFYAVSQIKSAPHERPPGSVSAAFKPSVPKSWDDGAVAELGVPLADPVGSPKHVSADLCSALFVPAQEANDVFRPEIPKVWDDRALQDME